jgi:hypothetical protein
MPFTCLYLIILCVGTYYRSHVIYLLQSLIGAVEKNYAIFYLDHCIMSANELGCNLIYDIICNAMQLKLIVDQLLK